MFGFLVVLVKRRPPSSTRTDNLLPYKPLFRSQTDKNHSRLRLSKRALGRSAALAAAPACAQSTSAGIGGQVTGSDGQPVAGAEVTNTDVESGTVSRATTEDKGRCNARSPRRSEASRVGKECFCTCKFRRTT